MRAAPWQFEQQFWDWMLNRSCSVAQSCPTLCDPMDCSMPGLPVRHQLPEFAHIHAHWIGDAIHLILCRPLLLCLQSFPASGLLQWVSSWHHEVLELQCQHRSFQWLFRVDFLKTQILGEIKGPLVRTSIWKIIWKTRTKTSLWGVY